VVFLPGSLPADAGWYYCERLKGFQATPAKTNETASSTTRNFFIDPPSLPVQPAGVYSGMIFMLNKVHNIPINKRLVAF